MSCHSTCYKRETVSFYPIKDGLLSKRICHYWSALVVLKNLIWTWSCIWDWKIFEPKKGLTTRVSLCKTTQLNTASMLRIINSFLDKYILTKQMSIYLYRKNIWSHINMEVWYQKISAEISICDDYRPIINGRKTVKMFFRVWPTTIFD